MSQTGSDAIAASFGYDQFGRRTDKNVTVNGQTNAVNYVYDGDQAVAEQVNGATTSQLTGIAVDEHIARYTGQDQLVYLTDALGSIIAQTKADGSFQNKYGYSPYGQAASDADDKGNPHQYTGRENDNTGLLFYRARYYMPSCGRFISEDPIGIGGGANYYAYVGGNPVSFNDPSGLLFGIDAGECAGADAAQYWADLAVKEENWLYHIPGFAATLWSPGVSETTLLSFVGWGAFGAGAKLLPLRLDFHAWGKVGQWSAKYKNPHFHAGDRAGLSKHHLPYQLNNWRKNFGNVANTSERVGLGLEVGGLAGMGAAGIAGAIPRGGSSCP